MQAPFCKFIDCGFCAAVLAGAMRARNRKIKRRTWVAFIFPNTASCLRLVSALLAECDEEWITIKMYLNLKTESYIPMKLPGNFYRKKVALP